MYCVLPVSRRGVRHSASLVRVSKQRGTRLFSRSLPASEAAPGASPSPLPKKRGFFKTVTLYSTGFIFLFYAVSPVVAFNNERYNAFFFESVPFGEAILDYAEDNGIDDKFRIGFLASGKEKAQKVVDAVEKTQESALPAPVPAADKAEKPRETVREKVAAVKASTEEKVKAKKEQAKEKKGHVKETVQLLKTKTEKVVSDASTAAAELVGLGGGKVETKSAKVVEKTDRPKQFSEGVEVLVKRVEAALAGESVNRLSEATITPTHTGVQRQEASVVKERKDTVSPDKMLYTGDLPVGFEPPPGFSRPKAQGPTPAASTSKPDEKEEDILPLLAPTVADIGASEPIISELASTIDSLAAFLKDNPAAASSAKGILDTAQVDLKELATRIEKARSDERRKLEAQLDEQAREYTMKLLELEMTSQDKLDEQEMEFKYFFEDERRKAMHAYREKLDNELRTQSEIINERLKAEVIAQGIEMQRRWIREIKVRVEEERGGRLAKLDELATNLKRLERVTLDNAALLDDNLRLHALWAALRALTAASIDSPERRPFRDELRVLRHASGAKEDELISVVLDTLERTDVPDVGVDPLPDLTTWFTTSVAPQVARVALVPEHDAGVLSYLTSYLISSFRFSRRGLVEGNDVLSVLARVEHYMNEKDLDSAARELNQLKGAPKTLVSDWLDAARRRLEVLQALEVVQAQATLASLRVV